MIRKRWASSFRWLRWIRSCFHPSLTKWEKACRFVIRSQTAASFGLPWTNFRDNKAGSVQLATPGARRLLHYLLACDQTKVIEANESLFEGLIAAWENTAFDPASANALNGAIAASGPWRLARLEASGFNTRSSRFVNSKYYHMI